MWEGSCDSAVHSRNACNPSLEGVLGFLVCCIKCVQVPCKGGSESSYTASSWVLAFSSFLRDVWVSHRFPQEEPHLYRVDLAPPPTPRYGFVPQIYSLSGLL